MDTTVEQDDAAQQRAAADVSRAGRPEASGATPATPEQVEGWLARARGAAVPGLTTTTVLALTRGDD